MSDAIILKKVAKFLSENSGVPELPFSLSCTGLHPVHHLISKIMVQTLPSNGSLAEPEGSGKANAATATVSTIAQNALSANNVLAQSVLAVYKGADYIRHGEPVNLKHSPIYVQPDFDIAPNPASNVVNANIRKPVSENRNLLVYRPDGQLVLNVIVPANSRQVTLDTQQLYSGIYFCKLTNSNSTAKLVIVK